MGKFIDLFRRKEARDQHGNRVTLVSYVVQPGDTLQEIADAHLMTNAELRHLNRIHKPKHEKKKLTPGKKLKVFDRHTLLSSLSLSLSPSSHGTHSQTHSHCSPTSYTTTTIGNATTTMTTTMTTTTTTTGSPRSHRSSLSSSSSWHPAGIHEQDEDDPNALFYDSQEEPASPSDRDSAISFTDAHNFLRPQNFEVNVIDNAAPRSKASQFLRKLLKKRSHSKLNTPSAREQPTRASCVEFDRTFDEELDRGEEDSYGGDDVINMHRALSEVTMRPRGKHPHQYYEDDFLSFPDLIGSTNKEILSHPRLSKKLVTQIENCLPHAYRGYDWKLVFSCLQHGSQLDTMLHKLRNQHGSLVLVETTGGDVFGGFNAVAWKKQPSYYGSGQSFVFSCLPKFEFFLWTRVNAMFMMSNSKCIAMGGGGDGFAWCLNGDLLQGTSNCSKTFNNKVLTSTGQFDVVHIEAWTFVPKRFSKK